MITKNINFSLLNAQLLFHQDVQNMALISLISIVGLNYDAVEYANLYFEKCRKRR